MKIYWTRWDKQGDMYMGDTLEDAIAECEKAGLRITEGPDETPVYREDNGILDEPGFLTT